MQDDMEAFGNPCDGSFGEAGDLEEAAGDDGSAKCVEGGRRFGLVGGDGGTSFEIGAGADGDFDVVEGALGFDDAVPVERRAGFSEGGNSVRKLAAVGARLQGGDGVSVQGRADDDVENHSGERQRSADSSARAFATGANFFGDETADRGEKDSGEEDCEEPEIKGREPVEGEAAGGERPEELDPRTLAKIEGRVKEGCGKRGGEDGCEWDLGCEIFRLKEEEGKSEEQAEQEGSEERVKVRAIESEIGGRAEVGADEVSIGDHSRENDSQGGGAGDAREGGALKRVGGEGVGQGIHRREPIVEQRHE